MRGHAERYSWAAYYAAAYENERKKNTALAGKIADAQRRQADLEDNLNRIYASPFWKATAPFRKLYRRLKGRPEHDKDVSFNPETDPYILRYRQEINRQRYPYLEWIRQENNESYDKITYVTGWRSVTIPESDIMILTYGTGYLGNDTFYKIKTA